MTLNNATDTDTSVDAVSVNGEDAPTTSVRQPWRTALRADLRGAIPDASLGLVVTASIFAILYWRVENDRSETTRVMPFMDDPAHWPYWLSQAFGWSALLWSWATVMLGLLVATKRPAWLPGRTATIEKLHRTTSLTVIGLTLAHMLLVSQHNLSEDGVLVALGGSFVPWVYSHVAGRFAILLGIIAFYLALALGLSYYARHRLGVRTWRLAHRFTIAVYILAVWHTFIYGTNVWFMGAQRMALWVMQLPIAALVLYRLLTPLRRREQLPLAPAALRSQLDLRVCLRVLVRLAAAASVVALVAIVALDRTGGHQRPAPDPTTGQQDNAGSPSEP